MIRAIVYAHYDRDGIVDDHVKFALQAYRPHADKIIFVSTSANTDNLSDVRQWCDISLTRPNIGYDFYSWKTGVEQLSDLSKFDEIIFTNDSIYGPLFDVADLFKLSEECDCDFWGLTRSLQQASHIQSFFFAFRRRPIADNFFTQFWNSIEIIADKKELIRRYEISLSSQLEAQGYKTQVLFDMSSLSFLRRLRAGWINGPQRGLSRSKTWIKMLKNRRPPNPTHRLWRTLLESGFPFLKVELLRDNPNDIKLQRVYSYLKKHSAYDITLIERHLSRMCSQQFRPTNLVETKVRGDN